MPNDKRTVSYDADLQIEAYWFEGIMQKFPNHFHDYYVIGFIEAGQRYLLCKDQEYIINPGDIIIFNPGDVHSCEQIDGKTLDYRCINIQPEIMKKTALEITGRKFFPNFSQAVLYRSELASSLQELHHMICEGETDFIKEELYLFLISQLIQEYADSITDPFAQEPTSEFKPVCDYMEANFAKVITLDELSRLANMSKYHFLRSFTRQKGISPYSYLETIRIGNSKKLLEQGIPPVEAAFRTGFSDQSHFSNFFKKFIGLTPRQYMRIFLSESSIERQTERKEL
ncbi:AraC family ligand binding domain-containing protein [Paenibacillus apiarius]|uniref:AraC family ligand binding domain-containing protein n=1 Tax=Paenibacillus apiarius TaxID=46240 RepID=UPI003B3A9575